MWFCGPGSHIFTIEPRSHKGLNWEIFQFYAQNKLISNLMPATGLKIVGTGACLPWCSISSFQNSLKMSGQQRLWVSGVLVWNLVPFLPDIGFQLLKILWSSLMMCQMFSICERFSTQTLLLGSHAVVIAAVCGFTLSCWNTRCLEGSICCYKTFIYTFQHS